MAVIFPMNGKFQITFLFKAVFHPPPPGRYMRVKILPSRWDEGGREAGIGEGSKGERGRRKEEWEKGEEE